MTNNDNPLKITADDRRFCGIECYNAICNDKDYFNALKKEIESGDYDNCAPILDQKLIFIMIYKN